MIYIERLCFLSSEILFSTEDNFISKYFSIIIDYILESIGIRELGAEDFFISSLCIQLSRIRLAKVQKS